MFITIEGGEGTGKSTQAKLLVLFLQDKGYEVVQTHEPGGTIIGEQIRDILLDSKNSGMSVLAELFLYQAARVQHVEELIEPALHQGKIVVCDRFYDATIAYQGFGRQIEEEFIYLLNAAACNQIRPDLTIILDLEVKEGLKRAIGLKKKFGPPGKGDRIESEKLEFHQRVRQGYLKIGKEEPERVKIIDASQGIEEIHQLICGLINERLRKN